MQILILATPTLAIMEEFVSLQKKSAGLLADVEKIVWAIIVRNALQVKSKIDTIYLFLTSIIYTLSFL